MSATLEKTQIAMVEPEAATGAAVTEAAVKNETAGGGWWSWWWFSVVGVWIAVLALAVLTFIFMVMLYIVAVNTPFVV